MHNGCTSKLGENKDIKTMTAYKMAKLTYIGFKLLLSQFIFCLCMILDNNIGVGIFPITFYH